MWAKSQNETNERVAVLLQYGISLSRLIAIIN